MRPGTQLIVDFNCVQYVSSASLGRLINLKKRVAAARGRVEVRCLHLDLREVF
jgi:anti-sigma B factor antagonist